MEEPVLAVPVPVELVPEVAWSAFVQPFAGYLLSEVLGLNLVRHAAVLLGLAGAVMGPNPEHLVVLVSLPGLWITTVEPTDLLSAGFLPRVVPSPAHLKVEPVPGNPGAGDFVSETAHRGKQRVHLRSVALRSVVLDHLRSGLEIVGFAVEKQQADQPALP